MSDNISNEDGSNEESQTFKDLRAKNDKLSKDIKTVREDAIAEVERKYQAESILGDQYSQLASYFADEVSGELNAESAAEWLKAKGLEVASPEPAPVVETQPDGIPSDVVDLAGLADVANLGSNIATVGGQATEASYADKANAIADEYSHAGDLLELTARIARLEAGQG